jgi:5-(carboxyamino)imidazole ribonucleotide mutase
MGPVALVAPDASAALALEPAAAALAPFGVGTWPLRLAPTLAAADLDAALARAEAAGTRVYVVAVRPGSDIAARLARRSVRPVLAVPLAGTTFRGLDALTQAVSLPAGSAVGALAIGKAGARNAGLLALAILALGDPGLAAALAAFRAEQTAAVLASRLPPEA